ncbi:GNAT family N-acetyltransferase [Flammeovirga sp. MY04]|uniref:GNAT family N-acetyltransferase n=1 Tax=Flammeovirga sp. MY04 TaxID=1191459 RepID=UPI000806119C|nr:GNAT family N-acetyltransferase [Flammeovirga sp. MY04]ANQ52151.1 GNAT family N-acetyltransferase [Flammeovirga sp. MY04]
MVRLIKKEDIFALKKVLDSIELFPSEYLEDMISDYLNNSNSDDIWFTKVIDGEAISLGYCSLEKFTNSTYNLLAIGVRKDFQSKSHGKEMVSFIENYLIEKEKRILIVETSGSAGFDSVRLFYEGLGYNKEAVIRDFWEEGDDKVIYWKKLN